MNIKKLLITATLSVICSLSSAQQTREQCYQEANFNAGVCALQCIANRSGCDKCDDQKNARFDRCSRLPASPKPSGPPAQYNGPGNQNDFARSRYECYKEAREISLNSSSDRYGSTTNAGVLPSCSMFSSCLAAKGYERVDEGQFEVTPQLQIKCQD